MKQPRLLSYRKSFLKRLAALVRWRLYQSASKEEEGLAEQTGVSTYSSAGNTLHTVAFFLAEQTRPTQLDR